MSGVAGIDDGAVPRTTPLPAMDVRNEPRTANNWNVPFGDTDNSGISASSSSGNAGHRSIVPPQISPFTADIGKREAQEKSPGNSNFWNTPFEHSQEQGAEQAQSSGKVRRQNKTPGNINSFNVPFDLPRQQGVEPQNAGKERRQSSGTTDLRLESGPLSGEDRDLDGAIPYMQVGPKARRQEDHSPHVEVGPPGLEGARNIIINKRQNQATEAGSKDSGSGDSDSTGYLGGLSRSGSGLNFENPSRDPATPPRALGPQGKRAQPDFRYNPAVHSEQNHGNRGADIPRVASMNRRQPVNSSTASGSGNNGSGFLGELASSEDKSARVNSQIIPSQ